MIQRFADWIERISCDHEWEKVERVQLFREFAGPYAKPIKIYDVFRCKHCLKTRKSNIL